MKLYSRIIQSPLGPLLAECSDTGLHKLVFAEEAIAVPVDQHSVLDECERQLSEYFAGRLTGFDLPLSQNGSAFQQKVWALLKQIPFAETISYTQLSQQYGDLKAIRAVAAANGKNNLAILIPCHRVIGSNATLTGYAGGLWRKQWLLDHERKAAGIGQMMLWG